VTQRLEFKSARSSELEEGDKTVLGLGRSNHMNNAIDIDLQICYDEMFSNHLDGYYLFRIEEGGLFQYGGIGSGDDYIPDIELDGEDKLMIIGVDIV